MEPLNRPAVIVADMLVDFVTGALANPPSQECIEPIARLLSAARERGWPICYANDAHLPGDMEETLWGLHALAGTPGAQVIPELAPQPGDFAFPKRWYSGFHETGLDMYLKQSGIDTVILTGQHAQFVLVELEADGARALVGKLGDALDGGRDVFAAHRDRAPGSPRSGRSSRALGPRPPT